MDAPEPSGYDLMLALVGGLLAGAALVGWLLPVPYFLAGVGASLLAAAVIAVGLFGAPPIDETG